MGAAHLCVISPVRHPPMMPLRLVVLSADEGQHVTHREDVADKGPRDYGQDDDGDLDRGHQNLYPTAKVLTVSIPGVLPAA